MDSAHLSASSHLSPNNRFDVFLWGTVFLDMVFAGMATGPRPGTEVWAEGMASCPGGIANLGVAASRLGLSTSVAAAFSRDDYGTFCWRTLEEQEGIDLSRSRRFAHWHTPVTVSLSFDDDRAMVSHGHPPPLSSTELIDDPPSTRAVVLDLADAFDPDQRTVSWPRWAVTARNRGALVFAEVGWDPDNRWCAELLDALDGCDAFMPNATEAMAYTRTSSPRQALRVLADRVPLAVVTRGCEGAIAIDSGTGEQVAVPAVAAPVVDPTGAGDVFSAALVAGTLRGWSLADRVAFSALCSALALGHYGGSLAAPDNDQVLSWWHQVRNAKTPTPEQRELRNRYRFLDDLPTPSERPGPCHRASATITMTQPVHPASKP